MSNLLNYPSFTAVNGICDIYTNDIINTNDISTSSLSVNGVQIQQLVGLPTFSVGDVSSVTYGVPPNVSISGNSQFPVLNFSLST